MEDGWGGYEARREERQEWRREVGRWRGGGRAAAAGGGAAVGGEVGVA